MEEVFLEKVWILKKKLKFSLSQLAAQLNQAAGTDPEKRKIADKVVLAIEHIVKRKSSLDERILNRSPILSHFISEFSIYIKY